MTNFTYTDCAGIKQPIDKYHLHEMCDRLYCMQEMFNRLIVEHPCAGLMEDQSEYISKLLSRLHQRAANLAYEFDEENVCP